MSNTRNGMAARKKLFAAGLQAIEFAASHILKLGHFLCHDFSLKETVTFVQFLPKLTPASLSRIPAARLAADSVNSDGNRSFLVVVVRP
jgi:hypothetical protein